MTEEPAEPRRPETAEAAGHSQPPLPDPARPAPPPDRPDAASAADDEPAAAFSSVGADDARSAADHEPTAAFSSVGADDARSAADHEPTAGFSSAQAEDAPRPPGGAGPPPGPGGPPPGAGVPPPWAGGWPWSGGAGFASRYSLVRPREGRYLAGVCAAIGRATNTDPILWRVLLAVLGFFGGIGIVIYVAAWLIIPAEGDSASPVESVLGRGRSSMSPVTVIVLGVLAVVLFGMIVTDRFLAVVLGAAVLVGGALLLNRNTGSMASGTPGGDHPTSGGSPRPGFPPGPAPTPPTGAFAAEPREMPGDPRAGRREADRLGPVPPADAPPPGPGQGAWSYASRGGPSLAPGQEPPSPAAAPPQSAWPPPSDPLAPGQPVPPYGVPPTTGGYRPPFAPHGPYAGPGSPPPAPPRPAKPPKPPRERSPLGTATFSMIFVAIGIVALLDLANAVRVTPSTYFFAALVTISLGLLVGAWLGRARWLIALGLVAAAALGISTVAESSGPERYRAGSVLWQPASYDQMAERYENAFGDAELDLSRVDFANRNAQVVVEVNFGSLRVILPPAVDVTARVDVNAGDAQVLGRQWSGFDQSPRDVTDNGDDGPGGGNVNLVVHVNAGSVEVHR